MKVPENDQEDFMINTGYLFVWNKDKIKYYELDKEFDESNLKYI